MKIPLRMTLFSRIPSFDFLRLRPYGDTLATPAVAVWLRFAWVVILLMASIEGIVWGLVGASIVPQGAAWLRPVAGLFMFVLMFAIIWIVDASLIMSERPPARARRWDPSASQGAGALARWGLGLLVRVAIVAVSLYVTAPFLAKLIRADDIASYHQRQVEQYYARRDTTLRTQIAGGAGQIETLYGERTQPLETEIARLTRSLGLERERRARIEAEYTPEIAVLRQDLAAARERAGDEILGRNGRPEGRGPEARKWEANANRLAKQLAAKQAEIDARIAAVAQRIADLEQRVSTASDALQRLRLEQQQRLDRVTAEVSAQQVEALPPRLTFAARSKALQALRDSPDEQGVPHFERVEGFAQAALSVLFFALIALKLFEPSSVRAYFNETLQLQYRKYLKGGLAEIPGFELAEDPGTRLNPVEFARLWQAYEADPAAFHANRLALLEAREPLLKFQAEQSLEHEVLTGRKQNLGQELAFARRRRERELAALDRELDARTQQIQRQFANETQTQLEYRRQELTNELQRSREDWERRKAQEEEELHLRARAFEQEQILARETLDLRAQEVAHLREHGLEDIRHAESERQRSHQRQLAEQSHARQREAYRTRLDGIHEELNRLRGLEAKQTAEYRSFQQAADKARDTIDAARRQIETIQTELAARRATVASLKQAIAAQTAEAEGMTHPKRPSFWSRGGTGIDRQTARDIKSLEKERKALEKLVHADSEQLARLNESLRLLEARQTTSESALREAEEQVAATGMRILFYEDSLAALLCSDTETHAPEAEASPVTEVSDPEGVMATAT